MIVYGVFSYEISPFFLTFCNSGRRLWLHSEKCWLHSLMAKLKALISFSNLCFLKPVFIYALKRCQVIPRLVGCMDLFSDKEIFH